MLKVGLVGVGGISGTHIPVWNNMENTELVAICDIRTECLNHYPEKRHYTNFDDMLCSEKLDILDICLPTYLHVDYAVKAMELGIHVICEKPISLKTEDVERAYSTAQRKNVKFMIAQVLRFWPEYEFLKQIYDNQTYGKLLSGYMSRLGGYPKWSWDSWMMDKTKSGLVPFDLHIHDLDFIVYAFGKPTKVDSHRSQLPNQDYISAVYEFPEFFITAEASWYAAPYPFSSSYRFQFENALITYEHGQCMIYQNDETIINLSANTKSEIFSINLPKTDAYANEILYFADCVRKDIFPEKVKPQELTTVIEILNTL